MPAETHADQPREGVLTWWVGLGSDYCLYASIWEACYSKVVQSSCRCSRSLTSSMLGRSNIFLDLCHVHVYWRSKHFAVHSGCNCIVFCILASLCNGLLPSSLTPLLLLPLSPLPVEQLSHPPVVPVGGCEEDQWACRHLGVHHRSDDRWEGLPTSQG